MGDVAVRFRSRYRRPRTRYAALSSQRKRRHRVAGCFDPVAGFEMRRPDFEMSASERTGPVLRATIQLLVAASLVSYFRERTFL